MAETTPLPFFRRLHQSTLDWIAVYVSQFFNALPFTEHIEVIVTNLPSNRRCSALRAACHGLLQALNHNCQGAPFGFAYQHVYMLLHYYVAHNVEAITAPCLLQYFFKEHTKSRRVEQRLPTIATEGDEVQLATLLIAIQAQRHGEEGSADLVLWEAKEPTLATTARVGHPPASCGGTTE